MHNSDEFSSDVLKHEAQKRKVIKSTNSVEFVADVSDHELLVIQD